MWKQFFNLNITASTSKFVALNTICFNFKTDCTDDTYGPGCLTDCHCRDQCDVISGHCSSQCEDGWVGKDCQQSRSAECILGLYCI